ncbi:eukaryotic porin domain-containing protein [Cyclospora cayetanensis]|uniref:Eukaryotic porin domain-containing protein n=1 Tax=Cyclospora cayetanensis TaxID=88456 RepID=A0A1D3CS04_9EIME|nr:eukaryotic porin domain-containing protein [Cyclospora cayetanensis]
MPFFSFLRCGGHSSDGRPRRHGGSAADLLPNSVSSAVAVGRTDSSSVAHCAEKGSGFFSVPSFGFFGGASEAAVPPSDEASTRTDQLEKARTDAFKRENEQPTDTPKKQELTQPISFEHFSREWMNISGQDTFDGFRLEGAKQVNKYLQTCHSFCLGTQLRESGYSYQFGPTVAISAPPDPNAGENAQPPPHFFAMAKLGTDGSLQGRVIKTICPSADVKFNFNSSLKDEQRNFYELSLDNTGRDWASSLKLAWQSCWILDGMFSQVLTPRLQAGCEITYVASNFPRLIMHRIALESLFCASVIFHSLLQLDCACDIASANGASMLAVGSRYNIDKQSVVSCQLSQQPDFKSPTGLTKLTHSCKVQYSRKVTDRLSMATEYEYSHPDTESALRMGWEYLFRQARVQGLIDSCGRISVFAQDYNGFGHHDLADSPDALGQQMSAHQKILLSGMGPGQDGYLNLVAVAGPLCNEPNRTRFKKSPKFEAE